MFTGLVETLGSVVSILPEGPGVRLTLRTPLLAADAKLGDSIAVNGCCLTVVAKQADDLVFEAGSETLKRTNLGELTAGASINLERALRAGDRLGGHYVTGHIDALGKVASIRQEGEWAFYYFEVPAPLIRQMASKGSVAVDGVSLTLVDVDNQKNQFSVALIPHTLSVTTLGQRREGSLVNIETDLLAKYVEQQLRFRDQA